MISYSQKELIKKTTVITLLIGFDQHGFPKFFFYAIKGDMLEKFAKAAKTGDLDLDKYGVIIEEGFGYPADDVWKKMSDNYGLEKDKITIIESTNK